MNKDIGVQFVCRNCERYESCNYYYNRKEESFICKYFHLPNILDKIRNDIQSLRDCSCSSSDGIIDDVESIIDKYIEESEDKK